MYCGDTRYNRLELCLMFMGKYQNSIDAKYRMIIPSKFRDELGYRCILTLGKDKCLYIYPVAEWENVTKDLLVRPTSGSDDRQLVRRFFANANECEIDKQGRIVIPQELREYAGIEKELVTNGLSNIIEVWSKAEFDKIENGI